MLIAARPDQAEIKALKASRVLDYPPARLEIIVARGKQPSAQRNAGMKAAVGELIYFLDDDSVPEPASLRRATAHFADPQVKMAGGPNLCPPDAPGLEQVFALVLGSWLAFGPSRARYAPVGAARQSSEKELILCNLVARRDAMLGTGRLQRGALSQRRKCPHGRTPAPGRQTDLRPANHRLSPASVQPQGIRQNAPNLRPGQGRAVPREPDTRLRGEFCPAALPGLPGCPAVAWPLLTPLGKWWLLPLAFYGVAVLAQTAVLAVQGGLLRGLAPPRSSS